MIGLPGADGRPIMRAYSIASPSWDDELEFYSIKVPDGPLTSRLGRIQPGDEVILRPKPVGTLVHDALRPGRRLYLIASGTGIAPELRDSPGTGGNPADRRGAGAVAAQSENMGKNLRKEPA